MWLPFILLSSFCWALVNVIDSLLVKNYEKHPVVLMWSQSLFSVVTLACLYWFIDVQTAWWPFLLGVGVCAYGADLFFFWVLDRLDVSVTNAAWPILSIFLGIAGYFLFQERWTALESIGAVLVIGGVLYLSFREAGSRSMHGMLGLLTLLALLYVPTYVAKKAAIDAGESVTAVFFWLLVGRELIAFNFPWAVPAWRRRILRLMKVVNARYFLISGLVIVCFLSGEYFGALSYFHGPISLVSVAGNVQPFMVIALAWVFAMFIPSHAPRELMTARSVGVKLISFGIVFGGLALLALPK